MKPTPIQRYKALRFIYKMNQEMGRMADVDSPPMAVCDALPGREWDALLALDRTFSERHLRLRRLTLQARTKAGLAGSPTQEVLRWIASNYTYRLPAWDR